MKIRFQAIALVMLMFVLIQSLQAQLPLPPKVPIWDGNQVTLTLEKITDDIYAVVPSTAANETTKGIPQATCGGIIVGEKGIMLIETMLSKRLYDQLYKLVRSVSKKPILYAVNTTDHGDHCFGNYLLPKATIILQNQFCKENLAKNFENIRQFMITLFGKGRGMEEVSYRAADIGIPKNQNLLIDMGGDLLVELINTGTAQSPADLFVRATKAGKNVWWGGNAFIAESPTIPWLFDGYFLEPVANLNAIYNRIGQNDIVIPGHGRVTNKAGIQYTIDYVNTLKQNITKAVSQGMTLDQAKENYPMKEFDKNYEIFSWLHYQFNIPNAYKDISNSRKSSTPN